LAPPLLDGFRAQSPYWLNDGAFKMRFHDSPLLRPKRVGMLRNVCVALGNWASPVAFDALCLALQDDEPLARGHAAWALGRIADAHGHEQAVRFLVATVEHESVEWVRLEIFDALSNCTRL
jgi:epoxyqueuosine reductase